MYLPSMVGIPLFLEFADLDAIYGEKATLIMNLLSGVDLTIFGLSIMLYTYMKSLVTRIEYNSETDEVIVR